MTKRTERDSIGEIKVDSNKFWGAQTQRSLENFDIGFEKMPWEIIEAFAVLKMAAAETNHELGVLSKVKMKIINKVTKLFVQVGELVNYIMEDIHSMLK